MNYRHRRAALAFLSSFLAGVFLIFLPAPDAVSQSSQRVTVSGLYASAFEPIPAMVCPDFTHGIMLFPDGEFRQRYERIKRALDWESTRAIGPTVFFRIRGVREPADESPRFFGAEAAVTVTATEELFSVENLSAKASDAYPLLLKLCKANSGGG